MSNSFSIPFWNFGVHFFGRNSLSQLTTKIEFFQDYLFELLIERNYFTVQFDVDTICRQRSKHQEKFGKLVEIPIFQLI